MILKLKIDAMIQFQISNPDIGINDGQFLLVQCRKLKNSYGFGSEKIAEQTKERFLVFPLYGCGVVAVLVSIHQGKCKK